MPEYLEWDLHKGCFCHENESAKIWQLLKKLTVIWIIWLSEKVDEKPWPVHYICKSKSNYFYNHIFLFSFYKDTNVYHNNKNIVFA